MCVCIPACVYMYVYVYVYVLCVCVHVCVCVHACIRVICVHECVCSCPYICVWFVGEFLQIYYKVKIISMLSISWCVVLSFSSLLSFRYTHVDLMFLNAGVMPVAGMKLSGLWPLTPR